MVHNNNIRRYFNVLANRHYDARKGKTTVQLLITAMLFIKIDDNSSLNYVLRKQPENMLWFRYVYYITD